jgi:hypothetical protein
MLPAGVDVTPIHLGQDGSIERLQGPAIVLGIALLDHAQALARLCLAVYRQPYPLMLLPPWPAQANLAPILDAPTSVVLRTSPGDQIDLGDADLRQVIGQGRIQVRCDQVLETALTSGVMAHNESGKPVLLRYRPGNQATPIYVTTIQMLTHTSRSDPWARESLLIALLQRMAEEAEAKQTPLKPVAAENALPTPAMLRAVVTGLAVTESPAISRLQALLAEQLFVELSAAQIETTLRYLRTAGCVTVGNREVQIDHVALEAQIDRLGVRAYVRELRRVQT